LSLLILFECVSIEMTLKKQTTWAINFFLEVIEHCDVGLCHPFDLHNRLCMPRTQAFVYHLENLVHEGVLIQELLHYFYFLAPLVR